MRVKLTISYDGTNYCGWQIQDNVLSVQQVVEDAIFAVTNERVNLVASGRTDAGVHAKGQVVHFDTNSTIPAKNFYKALNVVLPQDVKVLKSEEVLKDFNARRSAKRKTYVYSMYCSYVEDPLRERFAVRVNPIKNLENLKSVAKVFVGEHDFKCFCASKSQVKSTVRTIYDISVSKKGKDVKVKVTGNGFLYNMVRTLVGTLLKAGQNTLDESTAKDILEKKDRTAVGKTMPAKGLMLYSVKYK